MAHVLTMIAPDTLSDEDLRQFAPLDLVARLDDRAADIDLGSQLSDFNALQKEISDAGFDAHVSERSSRKKRLLICDMDSTIIEQECIDELGRLAGMGNEIAEVTEQAMRGELNFDEALTSRVAKLRGVRMQVVQHLLDEVITLSPGAACLVATMNAHGAYTALVSGGFTVFTGPVAERVGFAMHAGNTLGVGDDGKLTGEVVPPILGKEAKNDTLLRLCQERRISPNDAVAIGDGANDLAMIASAGLGIAYRAKPAVRDAADAAIDHTDLTAALYYQGLRPISM